MNVLYEAIMALGRSIDDLRENGWIQGDLGTDDGPKCATGVVSCAVLGHAAYPAAIMVGPDTSQELNVIGVMLRALCDAVPPKKRLEILGIAMDISDAGAHDVLHATNGSTKLSHIETMVVLVNDKGITSPQQAIEWFSDALDLLAEQLPIPEPRYPACEACQQGLGWDGRTEHVEGCPERVPELVLA